MWNPHLPQEIFDHIIDLLHNDSYALKHCCLVSKSWVPRTRKHLFADITFRRSSNIGLWKKTFPDVATFPGHHTQYLSVCCPRFVTASDAEEGGWIRAFSGVTSLRVEGTARRGIEAPDDSLNPFRKLSPTLKSLHSTWAPSSFHTQGFSTSFFPSLILRTSA